MNIDLTALRAIEQEKNIPAGAVLAALSTALMTAYRHTAGHESNARIEDAAACGLVALESST